MLNGGVIISAITLLVVAILAKRSGCNFRAWWHEEDRREK